MIFIRIVLIFIFSFFDSLIFFILDTNISIIFLVHFLVYLVIKLLSSKLANKCVGIPFYLVLFMPGLGGIIVGLLYVSLYYFKQSDLILSDYERYLEFEHSLEKEKKLNFNKEIGTFSFIDQIRLLDANRKKDLIVEYSMNHKDNKINAVQRGLQDGNSEVRYYSAVTINMLESQYTNNLSMLREKYNTYQDINSLMKLYYGYKDYLLSGLVSSEVYQVINLEYIDILLKIIERNKESQEILDQLVKAYLRSNNILKADEFNKIILTNYPNSVDGIINRIQIAYEKRDYSELMKAVKDAESNKLDNKEELNKHLLFWSV